MLRNEIYAEEMAGITCFAVAILITQQVYSIYIGVLGAGFVMLLNKYFKSGIKK